MKQFSHSYYHIYYFYFVIGNPKQSDEPSALKALHNFSMIEKKGFALVPEHVETRSLYNPEIPGVEQVIMMSMLTCEGLTLWMILFRFYKKFISNNKRISFSP